jgi:Zn-dependent M28 family amino/carboxypeptidase
MAQAPDMSGERMRAHVKFLADDLLEGRGVGTRGGELATKYIASQFAMIGAKPAGDKGTYFQRVPMVGATTDPTATLTAEGHGKNVAFRWIEDFVGVSELQQPADQFDAEVVFVGHGITAPEFQWDDFKGVDVKGKVLVLFTNEPASEDPKFFGGRALTYYGRWTYKYEEAARHGAKAVFIIHTTPTAGYGYQVLRNSVSKENPQLKLAAGEPALAFAGWMTMDAGQKLLQMAGKSVDEMLKAAESRDFHPIPLGIRMRGNMPTKVRPIESKNVAAMIPGSDPQLASQLVVFTAHWDHLGISTPVSGDNIYNGAVDNATGCSILLEIAHAWANQPQKPRRSALFLAVTSEEAGLLGSRYYAAHPIVPLGQTAVDLNFDGFYPFGRTKDISVTGADRTTLWSTVQDAVKSMNLEVEPEAHPEQGHYYRSDHFEFAHAGVPAFSISLGSRFEGKPSDYGEKVFEEYNSKHYHQPSDEYHDDWDFSGMEEAARLGFLIGRNVANQQALPTWHAGDEFLSAREKSGVK